MLIAHPAYGYQAANLFLDVTESVKIDFVKLWPRHLYNYNYYDGMNIYVDSVLCPPVDQYTESYVETYFIPNLKPLIFACPADTIADSVIRLTPGSLGGYVTLAELEIFRFSQVDWDIYETTNSINYSNFLSNPRFAIPDSSQPNGEGMSAPNWPGYPPEYALDGNLDRDGLDQVAHAASGYETASFFVDLTQTIPVDFVKVWPRVLYSFGYYEGMMLFVDSIACPAVEEYPLNYVQTWLVPNQKPVIFACPSGTTGSSTIQLTSGTNGYAQLAEIEIFKFQVNWNLYEDTNDVNLSGYLTDARFANYDASQLNGEGSYVSEWPGYYATYAIDGLFDRDGLDKIAHPNADSPDARFFVDSTQILQIDFVKIWPRVLWSMEYYEGMMLYVDLISCPAVEDYPLSYVQSWLIPNQKPIIFACPSGTTGSTIQLTRGTYGYVQLAEIEIFQFYRSYFELYSLKKSKKRKI